MNNIDQERVAQALEEAHAADSSLEFMRDAALLIRAHQPAGVAVPSCDICHGTRRVKEPGCDEGDCTRCLSAAPHPVSDEQKAVVLKLPGKREAQQGGSADFNSGYNAALFEVQFLNPGAHCIAGQVPAAQDVAGLVEALHSMTCAYRSAIASGYDRITELGGECDAVDYMLAAFPDYAKAKDLVTAHRSQQGAHKPSPSFVVSVPVPVKPEEPDEGIDDSWMDAYNSAMRMRADCVAAIEQAGGQVVQREQP